MALQNVWEPLRLHIDVQAPDAETALNAARAPVERVLDDLMFRLQAPLRVGAVSLIDTTAPVAVGQYQELHVFNSFRRWKFFATTPMDNLPEGSPRLRDSYQPLPNRFQRALDWYVKGLNASYDADRFLFYWVALELVEAGRDGRPRIPYRAPCGHEIPSCPQCNKPTDKLAAGVSIQEYLTEELGLAPADARSLWEMRQMVHGASDLQFGSTKMNELPNLVQLLRSAVTRALKEAMGMKQDELPIVPDRSMWFAEQGIGGSRQVRVEDLPA